MITIRCHPKGELKVSVKTSIAEIYDKCFESKDNLCELFWNGISISPSTVSYRLDLEAKHIRIPLFKIIEQQQTYEEEKDDVSVESSAVTFNSSHCTIEFHRTLRVPDNGKVYPLPPSFGKFRPEMKSGNIVLPMLQREAMWLNFPRGFPGEPIAVKIGVGNVNAINGERWDTNCGTLNSDSQNYIILPNQSWLDGIKVRDIPSTSPHETTHFVRQFVAMPITSKALIEAQLKERLLLDTIEGSLQFEVFKPSSTDYDVYNPLTREFVNIELSPEELKLTLGQKIIYIPRNPLSTNTSPSPTLEDFLLQDGDILDAYPPLELTIATLTGKNITLNCLLSHTVATLKILIQDKEGIPPDQQRLIYKGRQLEDTRSLIYYHIANKDKLSLILRLRGGDSSPVTTTLKSKSMGMAAGGLIIQKIYKDNHKLLFWNTRHYEKAKIMIINSSTLHTPITSDTYINLGYPWFEIYDEGTPALETTTSLDEVKSLATMQDEITSPNECSICLSYYTNVIFHPCLHGCCINCFLTLIKDAKVKTPPMIQCMLCRDYIKTENAKLISGTIPDTEPSLTIDKTNIIKLKIS